MWQCFAWSGCVAYYAVPSKTAHGSTRRDMAPPKPTLPQHVAPPQKYPTLPVNRTTMSAAEMPRWHSSSQTRRILSLSLHFILQEVTALRKGISTSYANIRRLHFQEFIHESWAFLGVLPALAVGPVLWPIVG